jgi:hypothetical protein
MNKLSPADELRIMIIKAEEKKIRLQNEIISDMDNFIEQLKPVNLVKKGISSITQTDHLKEKAIKGGVGIAAGYLIKKFFFKNIKRDLAIGLTGLVARQLITHFATPENLAKAGEKISSAIHKMRASKKEAGQEALL